MSFTRQSTKKEEFKHPFMVNGKYTDEFVFSVAEAFHFTALDDDQLASKFFMPKTSIRQLASRFQPEEILAIKKSQKKQKLIMVDQQYYQALLEVLMTHKIPFDDLQDATIQLEYKSKL